MALLDLEAHEDARDEGWVQVNGVAGPNRLIGDRLKQHGSAWIFNMGLAGWARCAAGGADKTKQSQEKCTTAR